MTTHAVYAGLQTTVSAAAGADRARCGRTGWLNDAPRPGGWAAVYDLKEIATHLKLRYGTGFRAPSLFDRFGVDSFGYVGNPALKPERSQGWEAGFTTDIRDAGRVGLCHRRCDLFRSACSQPDRRGVLAGGHRGESWICPCPWGGDRSNACGLRMARSACGLHVAEYHLGRPVSRRQGSQLLRRPQNRGVVRRDGPADYRPADRSRRIIYTGSAHDFLYDNNGIGIGYGVGQHGLIANLAASYTLTPQSGIYVNGWNIFYSKFEPVNGYQTPGPTVLAGVRFSFNDDRLRLHRRTAFDHGLASSA